MSHILLISGKSGHGKDTFANLLKQNLPNRNILIVHFADPVKWMCREFFNWNGDKITPQGRGLLQYVGTDLMRDYDKDYWCRMIGEFVAAVEKRNSFDWIMIPDARFPNEIEVVQEYCPDAVTVRIERVNKDGSSYRNPTMTQQQHEHPSEVSLDNYNFHYIVENSGDLRTLEESAKLLIEELEHKDELV